MGLKAGARYMQSLSGWRGHFDQWLQARGPPSVTTARRVKLGGEERAQRAGALLASKAVVCHLRFDWSEFANTCGFPDLGEPNRSVLRVLLRQAQLLDPVRD